MSTRRFSCHALFSVGLLAIVSGCTSGDVNRPVLPPGKDASGFHAQAVAEPVITDAARLAMYEQYKQYLAQHPAATPTPTPVSTPKPLATTLQPDWKQVETPLPWDYTNPAPSRSACAANEGLSYEVGPGQTYATPKEVPWLKLMPCDQVRIHYRPEPYHDIIALSSRGRANKYITIAGIPGPQGERPVLDGDNAVSPTNAGLNPYLDGMGMIIIGKPVGVPNLVWGYKPGYLHITGLKIQNAKNTSQWTSLKGVKAPWRAFTAGIYVNPAEHLAVTNCELTNNGLGLFVNSLYAEAGQSRNLLVSRNYFHDNGVPGNASLHNAYTEAIGTIYEYNYFGAPIAGTAGDNIKERSSGVVFRYNYIEDGVDLIALRDPQSNGDFEAAAVDAWGQKMVSMAFVYGNLLVVKNPTVYNASPALISVGDGTQYGDGKQFREGKVHFYNNRTISKLSYVRYRTTSVPMFGLVNTRSPLSVVARNNLFFASAAGSAQPAPFALFYWQGLADFQSNWINSYQPTAIATGNNGLGSGPRFDGSGLGDLLPQSGSPGFVNPAAGDYRFASGSPYLGFHAPLHADAITRGLVPGSGPVQVPFGDAVTP